MIKNSRRPFLFVYYTFYFLLFLLSVGLILGSLGFKRDSPSISEVVYLNTMMASVNGEPYESVSLPHEFENLPPETKVTLKAVINPLPDNGVYVKTIYSKADVFLDDKPVFTFGKEENYPHFMMDPATEIHIIETYGTGADMDLRIEYQSPKTISTLKVEPPMVGSAKELILERSTHYGISLSFALVQIISGLALLLISLCTLLIDKKGVLFIWLGLFSMVAGFWFFGANDFAITIFPDSTVLYIFSHLGLELFICLLIRFLLSSVEFTHPLPMRILDSFFLISCILSFLLQLLRICPLHISKNYFHILLFPSLLLITAAVIVEFSRYKNKGAGRFILPLLILSGCVFVETFYTHCCGNAFPFPLVQFGTLFFLLIMGICAGLTIRDSVRLQKLEKELSHQKQVLELQTADQRKRRLDLVENEERLSRQRHDLRHHLTAIQQMAAEDPEKLQDYLNGLLERLPAPKERFCENRVVNAIFSHFSTICEQNEIQFEVSLTVPETGVQAMDGDLCVVFANILENATEACKRMETGPRFIRIKSGLQLDMLIIETENSFNGEYEKVEDKFRSSKRNAMGIGLTSIQSIARQHHGSAQFVPTEKVFHCSVYLSLGKL